MERRSASFWKREKRASVLVKALKVQAVETGSGSTSNEGEPGRWVGLVTAKNGRPSIWPQETHDPG